MEDEVELLNLKISRGMGKYFFLKKKWENNEKLIKKVKRGLLHWHLVRNNAFR
jgi:hypothetical protein